ncbi:hypothetical protein SKAU_G00356720 [Synaphobranchus kaupii]|uniref:PDZ and LIM domain protein 5 n=1 Tax=Synaphobranchus kaupii TaxID=118154 RepID=A0A9Q1EHG7_SYNKA|nr:hypothetical protein SKAU_G00356720 [Synaphobranchus kaupii]
MSGSYSVTLGGTGPWGFRLQGGRDFSMPLTISRLTDGGKAAKAHISVGDVVLSIDGIPTNGMNHLEAQNKIKACTGNLQLTLRKATSVSKDVTARKDEPLEVIKPVPIAHLPPPTAYTGPAPSSSAYNKTARPFGGGSGGVGVVTSSVSAPKVASIPSACSAFTPASPAHAPAPSSDPGPAKIQPPFTRSQASPASTAKHSPGRSPYPPTSSSSSSSSARVTGSPSSPVPSQHAVYNTPINLYSTEKACEVAMGQRRGLVEGPSRAEQQNGSPRKPISDPDTEFHSPSPDSSRKRLVEDTEDWQPRSGTTQSRSFRILAQITGTEPLEGQQGDSVKNEVEPLLVVVPEMATQSPSSPPPTRASQRPGILANQQVLGSQGPPPSFGRVSNSAPSGRAAPQAHPGGQDSLVQRAEHKTGGTRTPLCGTCNKLIRGPYLVALGKSWHSDEFTCSHCHACLADAGFMEERGSVYCERCYEEFFAPACACCQLKIMGEVINALKQTWHVNCFLCAACKQPIRDKTFHLEEGQPYCERDYNNLFGTNCHGCDFPIEAGDKFLEALGQNWHDTCFVCAVCHTDLGGQAFFSKKDKPLCKKHAHSVNV